MNSLTDRYALRSAALDATLDPALRAVLALRFEQLGGEGADFHIADQSDGPSEAEAAVGFPITIEGEPCWEWVQHHPGGWLETVFVLSDDGPAQVLLSREGSIIAELLCAAGG